MSSEKGTSGGLVGEDGCGNVSKKVSKKFLLTHNKHICSIGMYTEVRTTEGDSILVLDVKVSLHEDLYLANAVCVSNGGQYCTQDLKVNSVKAEVTYCGTKTNRA